MVLDLIPDNKNTVPATIKTDSALQFILAATCAGLGSLGTGNCHQQNKD
jgi:hypothetical protein